MGRHLRGVAAVVGLVGVMWAGGWACGAEGEFTILPWELAPRAAQFGDERVGLGSLRECGFTRAAVVKGGEVAACKKLGMRALVRWDPRGGKANDRWAGLSDEQIEERVRNIVGK